MYSIFVEEGSNAYKITVYVEKVAIVFTGDNCKEDSRKFILDLLKETGRIGY